MLCCGTDCSVLESGSLMVMHRDRPTGMLVHSVKLQASRRVRYAKSQNNMSLFAPRLKFRPVFWQERRKPIEMDPLQIVAYWRSS
ncbi:hypothetical protein EVAR_62922_1 [Eumeta japonica]|uniref:Uncharacterized protein n=1 Tax=Eumeta variegata TaxID=151549 RepID=A0A4C1ZTA1_EUMVA|nr:hypothetical protein EVAR_62922_1 [Eumeta japonica]